MNREDEGYKIYTFDINIICFSNFRTLKLKSVEEILEEDQPHKINTPLKRVENDSILDISNESPIVQRIPKEKVQEMMRIKEVLIQDTTDDEIDSEKSSSNLKTQTQTTHYSVDPDEIYEIPDSISSDVISNDIEINRKSSQYDKNQFLQSCNESLNSNLNNSFSSTWIKSMTGPSSILRDSNFEKLDKNNIFLQNDGQ